MIKANVEHGTAQVELIPEEGFVLQKDIEGLIITSLLALRKRATEMGYPESLIRTDVATILMNVTSEYDLEAARMHNEDKNKTGNWEEL